MIPILFQDRPVDLRDPLFVRLINCVTPADHVAFVERFGELGGAAGSDPDQVELFAGRLREGVEFALGQGDRAEAAGWPKVKAWTANRLLADVHAQPRIALRDGAMRFILEAPHLGGFMALEVAAAVEAGARTKRCGHCHKLFLYGPHTNTRSDAKYCLNRCRVAAMRVRNANKES